MNDATIAQTTRRYGTHKVKVISFDFPRNVSPVYVVAQRARSILRAGAALEMPTGWTVEALKSIEYETGTYDVPHYFTLHHVSQLAQIGQALLALKAAGAWPAALPALDYDEEGRIKWLINFVKTFS